MHLEYFKANVSCLDPVEVVRKHIIFGNPHAVDNEQYYSLRCDVSTQYNVHPSEVLLVGSGMLGFSIAPQKRYREFCDESDLDIVILAPSLFDHMWSEVNSYLRQGGYWPRDYKDDFARYLLRGWIRPDKFPPEATFTLKHKWFEFFATLSRSGKYGPYKLAAGIYRSWSFLEDYQTICVEKCKRTWRSTVRTTATNRKLRELLLAVRDEKLLLQAPFQRRLVWTTRHKLDLIKTVLEGYPFPEIFLAAGEVDPNSGEAVELLVDGQQRISTLFQYFTGSELLKLPRDMCPYQELPVDEKQSFLQYDVVVRDLGEIDPKTIVKVFTRINSTSYDLNAIELQNARYDGAFKKFGEQVADLEFFADHRVFSATDIRRMNDLRFALWIVVTVLSSYFHRDTQLEEYLNEYNDEFPLSKKLFVEIRVVFDFINKCFLPDSCRCWKKADLFTLIVELQRAILRDKIKLSPQLVNVRLVEFYSKVDIIDPTQLDDTQISAYYKAALQASNDRSNRIRRGEILAELLRS